MGNPELGAPDPAAAPVPLGCGEVPQERCGVCPQAAGLVSQGQRRCLQSPLGSQRLGITKAKVGCLAFGQCSATRLAFCFHKERRLPPKKKEESKHTQEYYCAAGCDDLALRIF